MAEATKVGSIFYDASIDPKGVKKGADDIRNQLDKLKRSFNSLNPTVRALGVSLGAYISSRAIINFFKSTIEAANESARVMAQTNAVISSTGGAAGLSAEQIGEMAAQIQKMTPVSDEAAQSGMNMLLTFTGIGKDIFPQATNAMLDMATAMNGGVIPSSEELRGTAIQLGKALQDPILGVSALRRVGVNFNETQQKMIRGWVEHGEIARAQKFILEELATEFGGSLSAQARTFEGRLLMLNNQIDELKENIGRAIIPALGYLADALQGAEGGVNGLVYVFKGLASLVIGLVSLFRQLGLAIGAIFGGIVATIKYGIDAGKEVFKQGVGDMMAEGVKTQEALTNIWGKETDKKNNIWNKGMANQAGASGKKAAKVKKDLEEETAKYETELTKRNKNFEQSLTDLIFAHQDKVTEFKKQLDEENQDFLDSLDERKESFEEKMLDMTGDHEDKVKEIEKQIEEEVAKGFWGDKQQILDLQERLAQENLDYEEQVQKNTIREEEQTLKLKKEHDKRVADIQTRLTEEEEILTLHQSNVDAVKNKAREDDISRLIRQHNEENIEYSTQHAKRMIDIVEEGKSEGAAGIGAFSDETNKGLTTLKDDIDTATKEMGKTIVTNLATGAKEAGEKLVTELVNSINRKSREAWDWLTKLGLQASNPLLSIFKDLKNIPSFGAGKTDFPGGMALVGESGPELVHLPKGSDVIPNDITSEMIMGRTDPKTNQNINMYVNQVGDMQDIIAIGRELGFRAGLSPRMVSL